MSSSSSIMRKLKLVIIMLICVIIIFKLVGDNYYTMDRLSYSLASKDYRSINKILNKHPEYLFRYLNKDYESALSYATRKRDIKAIQILLAHGADPNYKGKFTENNAIDNAVRNNDVAIFDMLIKHHANLSLSGKINSSSPLILAIKCHASNIIDYILTNRLVDINISYPDGGNVLETATIYDNII